MHKERYQSLAAARAGRAGKGAPLLRLEDVPRPARLGRRARRVLLVLARARVALRRLLLLALALLRLRELGQLAAARGDLWQRREPVRYLLLGLKQNREQVLGDAPVAVLVVKAGHVERGGDTIAWN